jgi:colicin import membrane protein
MSKKLLTKCLGALATMSVVAACVSVKPGIVAAPVAPTSTMQDASRKLAFVKLERARAEARFVAGEQLCYTTFFTNNCLDKVREEHRAALANVRAIEIEAEHFERKTRADERDASLLLSQQKFDQEQASLAAQPPPPPRQEPPAAAPRPPAKSDRGAEHAARLKRIAAQEQAGAAQRDANVKAFEARKAASEQRLQAVERKKAETARTQAEKAAADKAAADKLAADKAAQAARPAR